MRGLLTAGALAFVACGLDVSGSAPTEVASSTGVPPPPPGFVPPGGGDAGGGGEGGSSDGGSPLEGGATTLLTVTLTPAPTMANLTMLGSLDWAHWGYTAAATPVRRMSGGNLISDFTATSVGMTGSSTMNGWVTAATWSNGDTPKSPSGGSTLSFRYFFGSDATTVKWTMPASSAPRTFSLYASISQIDVSFLAALDDGGTTQEKTRDTGPTNAEFYRVDVAFATPQPGRTLTFTFKVLSRHNTTATSAIAFGSATLSE